MAKIKLLIITHHLDKGGVEEVILMYAKFLPRDRYEVAVAYRVRGIVAEEIEKIVDVQMFCFEAATKRKRFNMLLQFARKFGPDLVHNHFNWLGMTIGRVLGVPCVETVHNTYHFFTAAQKYAYAFLLLFVSRIIAVSKYVRDFTVDYFPLISDAKVTVIHNGIDVTRFQVNHEREKTRRILGIGSNDFVIGFIGRLEEQKGLVYLLKAAKELNTLFSNLRFLIVGDGTLRKKLEERAAVDVLDNVQFLGYQRDTPKFYSAFDVFVLPSFFEGLPVSVIEAFAAGCPVIGTRVGGVPEVIEHEVTGLLVEPGSSEQITDALRRLITQPELGEKLRARGRQHAQRQFSIEAMIGKTELVYSELLRKIVNE